MLKNLFWSWTCHLPHCVFFMVVSLISGYSISYKASILQLVNSDRQQRNTIVHRFALLETWSVKRHAEKAQYITACLRHRVAVLACHQLRTFEELWNEKYNKGGFRLSRFQSYIKEECCSNMKCVASLKNPLRVFRKKNIRGDARRSYTCPRPNVFIKYCRASQLNMGIQSFRSVFIYILHWILTFFCNRVMNPTESIQPFSQGTFWGRQQRGSFLKPGIIISGKPILRATAVDRSTRWGKSFLIWWMSPGSNFRVTHRPGNGNKKRKWGIK